MSDPVLAELARKHGKTAAQVVIRWRLDSGLIVIPKSVTPSQIAENLDVFDFRLDADDLAQIGAEQRRGAHRPRSRQGRHPTRGDAQPSSHALFAGTRRTAR